MPENDTNVTVSLLIPIYNAEKYLKECLDSAAAQTLDGIEIICINDGSKDSSRDIIQSYMDKDPRFRVIDKPNSGYGISMNMGLKEARGEYIGILESDDFVDADELETLYKVAKENDADVVKSNFYEYWTTPEPKNKFFEYSTEEMCNHLFEAYDEPQVFWMQPSIWSAIYKKSFLNENDIDFLETPGASYQDTGFNFKVWCAAKRAYCVHDAFLHYRQDNAASSIKDPKKLYFVCDEYEEMFRYLHERFPEKADKLDKILVSMQYDTYMWNYERLDSSADALKLEWLERFSKDFKKFMDDGLVDFSLYSPWKPRDMRLIIDEPKLFKAMRDREGNAPHTVGTKRKSKKYYKDLGGKAYVERVKQYRKEY